jgi:hypothetical protein
MPAFLPVTLVATELAGRYPEYATVNTYRVICSRRRLRARGAQGT